MLRRSPQRYTFQKNNYIERQYKQGLDLDKGIIEMFDEAIKRKDNRELDVEWQKDNMEYDLRTSDYIVEKCKDKSYAQNLYAAMCNNDFVKNDVWPILTDKRWSCSWRYAGGIIADIREEGDYIDWYCSGIRDIGYEFDPEMSEADIKRLEECQRYVSESVITDEIREDLFKLGWIPVEGEENDII